MQADVMTRGIWIKMEYILPGLEDQHQAKGRKTPRCKKTETEVYKRRENAGLEVCANAVLHSR